MPATEYKLFLDDKPAKQEHLDRFEDISVQQEVDMAWEARLQLPLCVDENGKWSGEDEDFLAAFKRVRIEVKVGDGEFSPLIDGPIVGSDSKMGSAPAESILTLIVRDDSVYLHREETVESFENKSDGDIARQIFQQAEHIDSLDVESTPAPSSTAPLSVMQRGTPMQILRVLAKRQGMHAYVLPGPKPGKSIGTFKKYPTRKNGLPDMVLLGEKRNLASLKVTDKASQPAKTRTSALSLSDGTVTKAQSRFSDLELLGSETGFEKESNTGSRLLSPEHVDTVDLDRAVQARTEESAFSFEAEGSVLSECYPGVLSPYQVVTVLGANGHLSGDYVLRKVTHTLTRNYYGQSFAMTRNARSGGTGGGPPIPRLF